MFIFSVGCIFYGLWRFILLLTMVCFYFKASTVILWYMSRIRWDQEHHFICRAFYQADYYLLWIADFLLVDFHGNWMPLSSYWWSYQVTVLPLVVRLTDIPGDNRLPQVLLLMTAGIILLELQTIGRPVDCQKIRTQFYRNIK